MIPLGIDGDLAAAIREFVDQEIDRANNSYYDLENGGSESVYESLEATGNYLEGIQRFLRWRLEPDDVQTLDKEIGDAFEKLGRAERKFRADHDPNYAKLMKKLRINPEY